MKLTKEQRHVAYIILKCEMEKSYTTWGFCVWIFSVLGFGDRQYNEKVIQQHFPELWRKKPKKPYQVPNSEQGCLWFNSNSERLNLLEKCIKETSN